MDSTRTPLDTLQGWLVLAPLAVLCAPPGFSPFDGAPDTTSIGTGVAALGVLPAVLLALLRGRGDRALPMAPLWIVLISAAVMVPRAVDTFGAWRSLTGLCAAVGFVVSGASLGASGRRVLQRGLGALAVVLLLCAPMGAAWTGALGNTGDLSEAALPCAILGAGVFLTAEGFFAFLGFAAILLYGLYAGFVPVYAGLASLAAAVVVAGVGAIAGRHGGEVGRKGAAKRLRILLVALLLSLLPVAFRAYQAGEPAEPTSGSDESSLALPEELLTPPADSTTGGIEFRKLTWARVPDMIADHVEFGVGPGQFQAAFPPYRDPAEITLSTFNRREPTPNEVEHAHNDWLTAVAEHGPIGGGAFVLFLLIILWRSSRACWGEDGSRRDFGFAAIAVLVNAAFNSPLLYGPAAPAIAFAIFGVVGSPPAGAADDEAAAGDPAGKLDRALRHGVPALALLLLALVAPRAIGMVNYGRALAETPDARIVLQDGREQLDGARLSGILERAADAAPDSPIVLEKQAQLLRGMNAPLPTQRDVVEDWLRVRPLGVAPNLASGVLSTKEGDFEGAREDFERARSVDEGNPRVLANLLRVACDLRSPSATEAALEDLDRAGLLTPESLRMSAIEQMLTGRLEVAAPLVRRMTAPDAQPKSASPDGQLRPSALDGEAVDVLDANSTYSARKRAQEAGDDLLADAYNVAFQMVMALDHLESGLPAQAAISAHQALQSARDLDLDLGPIRLRKAASKAAAAVADGAPNPKLLGEARDILAEQPIRTQDRAALTEIEKTILRKAGLFENRSAMEPPR